MLFVNSFKLKKIIVEYNEEWNKKKTILTSMQFLHSFFIQFNFTNLLRI